MPPRVSAAALSTLWNRWCTARRFQRVAACVLGCADQEDSIEHHVNCPHVRKFAASFLGLAIAGAQGMEFFMLADAALDDETVLTKDGILIYAVFRVTESLRRQRAGDNGELQHMLQQTARNTVRGHLRTARVLDNAWFASSV